MRFPSIRDFKKSLKGKSGFVVFLVDRTDPDPKNTVEIMYQGPLGPEQLKQIQDVIISNMSVSSVK